MKIHVDIIKFRVTDFNNVIKSTSPVLMNVKNYARNTQFSVCSL